MTRGPAEANGASSADCSGRAAAEEALPVPAWPQRLGQAQRVRIYLTEADTIQHEAAHLSLLELLRKEGAAGASVFRGVAGFGAPGHLHTAALADVAQPLPLVLEWVDTPERVQRLLPTVCAAIPGALITLEELRVVQAGHRALREVPQLLRVGDVMTPAEEVDCVAPETPLHDLVQHLLRKERRAVPVVDAERRVVGIITNSDLVDRAGLPLRLELLRALGDPDAPRVAAHLTGLHGEGRTAASIMTQPVVTTRPDLPVTEAAKLMLARRLKRLPVVDAQGRLLGMLSRMDVLKTATTAYPLAGEAATVPPAPAAAAEVPSPGPAGSHNGPRGRPQRVGDVMNRFVPTVTPDTPLPEVLAALVSTRLNRAVVVDEARRPVGIIVDVDLMQRVTPAAHPSLVQALMRRVLPGPSEAREQWQRLTAHTAKELMRPRSEMLVVPQDAPLASVIDQSLERRIKLIAIVDDEGRLAGMADRADLLAALAASV